MYKISDTTSWSEINSKLLKRIEKMENEIKKIRFNLLTKTSDNNFEIKLLEIEANYSKKNEVEGIKTELDAKISQIENTYSTKDELNTVKTGLESTLDLDKAELKAYSDELNKKIETLEGKLSQIENKLSEIEGK